MKKILMLAAFLPNLALAHGSTIECKTTGQNFGTPSPVTVNIAAAGDITKGETTAVITSMGNIQDVFNVTVTPVSVVIPPIPFFGEISESTLEFAVAMGPISGVLTFNVKSLLNASLVPTGTGLLTLSGDLDAAGAPLLPAYDLSECVGLL